jgi:streptogramin lyase
LFCVAGYSQAITEFPVNANHILGITAGADGALWAIADDSIVRITTTGVVTTICAIPTVNSGARHIALGPDNNLWFDDFTSNSIGRCTPGGVVTEFPVPTPAPFISGITAGPDGAVWFTETADPGKVARITTSGVITEFPLLSAGHQPTGIVTGPDHNLWVGADNAVWRITPGGVQNFFPLSGVSAFGMTSGADGNVWFTVLGSNSIGRITTAGVITLFPVPHSGEPIVSAPDGALYYVEGNLQILGRITTDGVATEITGFSGPPLDSLAVGSDRNIWVTEIFTRKVARVVIPGGVPVAVPAMSAWGCGLLAVLLLVVAWRAWHQRLGQRSAR